MGVIYKNIDINLEKIFGLSVDDYYYYDVSVSSLQNCYFIVNFNSGKSDNSWL